MKITVAITGASGTIYARRLIEFLNSAESVERVVVVMTRNGADVARHEIKDEWGMDQMSKVVIYDNGDLFTPIASGSAAADAMVIVPCSMGMVGRIASGVSDDLISRAADVMIKERLPLIVVPRETPMSLIHLRNLVTLSEAGATILPASPSFYHNPHTVEELIESVIERVIKQLKIEKTDSYRWKD